MPENEEVILDWVHLPAGVEAESMWAALHDARLFFVASDRLARTITLKFEIFYLEDGDGIVTLQMESVVSLRVTRAAIWPGEFVRPEGITWNEQARLVAEYQAKWREDSLSWSELEAALGQANVIAPKHEKDYLNVSNASVVGSGNGLTLHLEGSLLSNDLWHEIYLRGSNLALSRDNGESLDLEQLIVLGEAWWDNFARKKTN